MFCSDLKAGYDIPNLEHGHRGTEYFLINDDPTLSSLYCRLKYAKGVLEKIAVVQRLLCHWY